MKLRNILIPVLALLLFACGSKTSTEEKDDGSIKIEIDGDDTKNLQEAINKTKDAFSDLLSDGKEDGKTVEVVNWRDLKDLMPNKISGLRLDSDNIEGQTTSMMGFKFSSVEGDYEDGDSKFEVKIIDVGGVGFLVKSMAAWADASIDSDTNEGYQKTIEFEGYKAFEQYNEKDKSGSFSVLVEDRFVVTVSGRNIEMDDLKDAIDDLNINKLARMAK